MPRPWFSAGYALMVLAAVSGCAPAAAPARAPAPSGMAGAGELVPDSAALAVADAIELAGTELGTMWTFENPPLEYWRQQYDFAATPEWLERVRLASVRYGQICSASFVSPAGLAMTNHHCARDCVEAVSTPQADYVVNGFYAPTPERELVCPDLYLDQLVEIEDVTQRVEAAAPAGAAESEIASRREAEREAIERECEAASDLECQAVVLFQGGQFKLYKYRRFQPVKLVFAPELQAGFFGGDPDNFTYPRYALDVAFVRAYDDTGRQPASTPQYFRWDMDGAQEGELVFVTGNPGSTSRLATVSQLLYEERLNHPFTIQFLEQQREFLQSVAQRGPEAERAVRNDLFSVENSLKAYQGQLGGLSDEQLVGRKIRWEREFQQRVAANPALQGEYGDVWDRIATLQARKVQMEPRLKINDPEFIGSPFLQLAALLVEYLQAAGPGGQPEQLEEVRQQLTSPVRVSEEFSQRLLQMRLQLAQAWLPADDPFVREAFRPGESPEQAATRLIRESRVDDLEFRRALVEAGPAALDTVSDPMLRLARQMVSVHSDLEPVWEEITVGEEVQRSRLARALFAVYGTALPPDATFTLRITDGVVQGYPFNGTFAPYKTTYYGMYERAANFNNTMPWQLPEAFARARDRVNLGVPLNFVTTNDITGGNSGSPMIDREARVVGVAFDSNIEGLPNEYLFAAPAGRTVGVHSAGILEALRSVYGAAGLADELMAASR